MKKIYLTFLTVVGFGFVAISQPILTLGNFTPNIGDSQLYYVADTNSVLNNTTGANVIFDYSGLRGYGDVQTQHFVNPTTTTNTGDFPTATYTDTTAGFAGNLKYNQNFTDSLNVIGLALDIPSFGAVVGKYDVDNEIYMKFPFTYGDSFTDNYAGSFTAIISSVPVTTAGVGDATVTADAWGTLKLPMTPDIDSVIRVTRVENLLTDTIFLQPFAPDILPFAINATQVAYFKPSISKNAIISFITADVNGDTNINVLSQYPMFGVGLEEINNNISSSLFPNPTNKNYTTLTINLESKEQVTVTLLNNLGQNIAIIFDGALTKKENTLKIKTANLSSGLYFVNIKSGNKVITEKLIIE